MAKVIGEPVLKQFKNVGDYSCGELVDVESFTMDGKPAQRYVFEERKFKMTNDGDVMPGESTGDMFVVLGTADLTKKIRRHHIGKSFHLSYEGEKVLPGGGNLMKVFQVLLL